MNKMRIKITGRLDKKLCNAKACPAVLRAENGDILIIGTDVTDKVENLSEFYAACASDERIVRIPKNVFDSINR